MKSLRQYVFENLIIFESQESKSIDAAKKLVMDKFGWDRSKADSFVRNDLRQDLPSLRDVKTAKFILGVTRMFVDGQLKDATTINDLNTVLPYISRDGVIDKWDRNLNGKTTKDVIKEFMPQADADAEAKREETEAERYSGKSGYEIVPIDSFEEAEKYAEYTSWCITHDKNAFNSYTGGGLDRFWFCLKREYKNIKKIKGVECPLDEYGLSMLAVCVRPNGTLKTCTCRWNHDNGGNDNTLDEKEISKIIKRNFYDTFAPNKEYVRFAQFDELEKIHENPVIYRVKKDNKYNICDKDSKLFYDRWFDYAGGFKDGFAVVGLNNKRNYINKNGELISDRWFDDVREFNEGFAEIKLNDKYNFINKEGKLISNQWFDDVNYFFCGFANVKLNQKYNYVNKKGILLSDQWFDYIGCFYNGFAEVRINGRCNSIDREGNIVSDIWFDFIEKFKNGFATVRLNKKYNIIDTKGKLISDQWFENLDRRFDKFAMVQISGIWYPIRPDGSVNINDEWRKLSTNEQI